MYKGERFAEVLSWVDQEKNFFLKYSRYLYMYIELFNIKIILTVSY